MMTCPRTCDRPSNKDAARTTYHVLNAARLLALILFVVLASTGAPAAQTNVVIITADNLGYGDLGCYGNPRIKTPNIDRLATQSVRCVDFYTASPTCTVSRASLLTGRYPQRHGLTNQLPGIEGNYGVGLKQTERLIPYYLKKQGYKTACFGKWNIGFAPGSRPTERGFDEFFGHASGNIDYQTHVYAGKHDMFRGTEPEHVDGYSTDLFADAACEFIERNAERPFFVYLPFNAPHFPSARNKAPGEPNIWQALDWAFEVYGWTPDEKDSKKRYYAVITALDAAIGRVQAQIDKSGLSDNTIVVFFSDNGAFMLKNRGLEVASNAPLRDGGVTLWEGGIRVPCLVRWPGKIEPGTTCDEPLLSCDFFALALSAAGAAIPDDRTIDGKDPTAALANKAPSPHRALYFQFRKYRAVREGRYKLLKTNPKTPWKLFDLENDLGETTDLRSRHPHVASRLQHDFESWSARVGRN